MTRIWLESWNWNSNRDKNGTKYVHYVEKEKVYLLFVMTDCYGITMLRNKFNNIAEKD